MKNKMITITEFVAKVCPDLCVEFNREDDAFYDYTEELISIDPNTPNTDDDGFIRHIVEKHHFSQGYNYPMLLWTILHEIGHHETEDLVEDYSAEFEVRTMCAMVSQEVARSNTHLQDMYYDLESEWLATEWAIQFVQTHADLCREFIQNT